MKNSDMPAMPVIDWDIKDGKAVRFTSSEGLTKREAFAMAALQGLSGAHNHDGEWSHDSKIVAEVAVKYADALLEELERTSCNSN
ncbi:hypothetical protein AYJ01_00720 [Shewanella algae]|uniref:hypothetical protein n=1 Tax=Shewanella algae TaxID=38313 RepID=UPI0011836289|nr:hypothetical protein [Shewanella algae]TVK95342.1 hypothetical protein AYJ01_00720 [Shewanella algae]